ncbi:hypothetical protein [Marinospirillum sp.]|uniref:LPS-assembly lipoprotein LptE n=1 Tax=Marinospirillum sp. TaxID=2183934 RepID=UPI003A88F870
MRSRTLLPSLMLGMLLLSACGFQLRGYIQLPAQLQPIRVEAQAGSERLAQPLRQRLLASGIRLAESDATARLLLRLEALEQRETQLIFGQDEEFALELTLVASAFDAEGEPLFTAERWSAERQYRYNATRDSVLARQSLKAELIRSMEDDLIDLLMMRVRSLELSSEDQ